MTVRRAGEARAHGRLDAPTARFRLRAGLAAPGALPLTDAVELVLADWDRQVAEGKVAPLTAQKATTALRRFAAYAAAFDAPTVADVDSRLCQRWTESGKAGGKGPGKAGRGEKPSVGYQHYRRSVLRQFFATCRALGLHDRDPAQDVRLPPREDTRYALALTDEQADACRKASQCSLKETRLPAAVALALAGMTTGELPAIRVRDLHLDHAKAWAHGGGVRTAQRWVDLDDWPVDALRARVDALAADHDPAALPDALLIYNPRGAGTPPEKRQAAACQSLAKVLRLAGLGDVPGLRPASFTEHAAHRLFRQTGRVEAVAAALGMASLDAVCDMLGHDWRDGHRVPGPPGVPDPVQPTSYAGVPSPARDSTDDAAEPEDCGHG